MVSVRDVEPRLGIIGLKVIVRGWYSRVGRSHKYGEWNGQKVDLESPGKSEVREVKED